MARFILTIFSDLFFFSFTVFIYVIYIIIYMYTKIKIEFSFIYNRLTEVCILFSNMWRKKMSKTLFYLKTFMIFFLFHSTMWAIVCLLLLLFFSISFNILISILRVKWWCGTLFFVREKNCRLFIGYEQNKLNERFQ